MPYMPPACISHAGISKDADAGIKYEYIKRMIEYNSAKGVVFQEKGLCISQIRQEIGVESPQDVCKKMQIKDEKRSKDGECIEEEVYERERDVYNVEIFENMGKNRAYKAENNAYMAKNSRSENNAYTRTQNEECIMNMPFGLWAEGWVNDWNSIKQKSQTTSFSSPLYILSSISSPPFHASGEKTGDFAGKSPTESSYLRKVSSTPSFSSISTINSENEEYMKKNATPRMVRKKSGELVKSSLKGEKQGSSQSISSMPILHKNVQFATKLEQVRHFSQAEKPTAVSAEASPRGKYCRKMGFECDLYEEYQERFEETQWDEMEKHELVIEFANFHEKKMLCLSQNVQLENVYLSSNKRNLLGKVAVKNLAFEKSVGVRFTMDHWQTISEVNAEYADDMSKNQCDGFDRFVFNIKLHELVNIQDKILYLCIRYRILGEEFWDNNSGMNYQIEFRKKLKANTQSCPTYRPVFSTDFNLENNMNSDSGNYLTTYELYRNKPSYSSFASNNLTIPHSFLRKKQYSNNIFSSRYDFSASLTAAIEASNNMNYDKNKNLKINRDDSFNTSTKNAYLYSSDSILMKKTSVTDGQSNISFKDNVSDTLSLNDIKSDASFKENNVTNNLFNDSFKPSVDSVSYKNFINNYCFVSTIFFVFYISYMFNSFQFRGSDKMITQNIDSKFHINENLTHDLTSDKKTISSDSLSFSTESGSLPSFSSDKSLFYPQLPLTSISSSDSVPLNISKPPSESRTSIDLHYNHLVKPSLSLETPGNTLTAIRT
ncbi:hypothetical protein PORY_001956 [Pneumocystis oryctolagi]|uniref:Uncharacterized protein n=1 Tax=Pneumocystis oryctolagi TaxID=42067 RepID=A0ACB7CC94_9ASCO|nr:hypothetical protein PORY_001956 [Pneumocystis oryctolagi]